MGLKVNALLIITGQIREFQLSQTQLERASRDTIHHSCEDVSLEEQVRLERVSDLQFHYNLVFPSQQRFGSMVDSVSHDFYQMANDGESMLTLFMRGARFAKRTMNMRSQKARCMRIAPSLDRLLFSRVGDDVEDEISLSEVMVRAVARGEE